MTALRDNAGKPDLSYLLGLPKALEALSVVFEQGAIKYERNNWKKGGKPDAEYLGAALRHIFKATNNEDFDPETGALHLAHAIWNLAALIELNMGPDTKDPDFDQELFRERYSKKEAVPPPSPPRLAYKVGHRTWVDKHLNPTFKLGPV